MRPVDIIINSSGNLGAVDAARKSMDELRGALSNIAGISVGVGLERAFEGVKESIRAAGQEFVRFTADMETAQYSIAAMQRQFAPGQFRDFRAALAGSADVIDIITRKANEMNVGIEDAVETYKTSAGAMYAGGIRDLQKQVDLALMLQQAMRGLGVSGFQATRDIQDILSGRSHMTKAGRELGLSDEEIKKAEDAGRLYEFLNDKLGAYAEAGKAAGDTLNAEFTRFQNTVLSLGKDLSAPMFEQLKKGVGDMLAELQKPEFRESLRPLGEAAESVAHTFFEGTKLAAEHADVILGVAKAFGELIVAVTAFKGLQLGTGLAMIAAKWIAAAAATDVSTAALMRNIAAARAAAAAQVAAGGVATAGGAAATGGSAAGAGAATAAGAVGVGIGGVIIAGITAAIAGWKVGNLIDDQIGNPFRSLHRNLSGHEWTGSSGKDDRAALAERETFEKDTQAFGKGFRGVSSSEEKLTLEKRLEKQIESRKARLADAGYAEKHAIEDSIEGLQRELALVQKLTEEQIKSRKSKADAETAVNNFITEGGQFGDLKTGAENDLQGAITGVSAMDAKAATEKRLQEAREKSGLTDFSDFEGMRDRVAAVNAHGDRITAVLDASAKAKARQKAGEKFNPEDILSDKDEKSLQEELGHLAHTLKVYREQFPAGIAAQEELRQQNLKLAEAFDQRLLENAKSRGDGQDMARLEEKMVHDKALEQGKSFGMDPKSAEYWAQGAVETTKAERAASLERFDTETKIAALKKAGRNEEARALERDVLKRDLADKYGLNDEEAGKRADAKIASEKTNVGAIRPEVDRFTRIGLFTGAGARNPLEGIGHEANAYLKKIMENTSKQPVTQHQLSIIGDF